MNVRYALYYFTSLFLLIAEPSIADGSSELATQIVAERISQNDGIVQKDTQSQIPSTQPSSILKPLSTSSKPEERASTKAIPGSGAIAMQVISGLGLVTLAIFLLAWIAKRLGAGAGMQQKNMKVLGSLPLGAREKTVLLEVENKKILVGVTAGNVSCLHVFDETKNIGNDAVGSESKVSENPITDAHANEPHVTESKEVGHTQAEQEKKWDFAHYLKQLSNRESNNPL